MSDTKHTPTPWKYDPQIPRCFWRGDATGEWLGSTNVETNENPEADAAFIVRAVNNHQRLLDALRAFLALPHLYDDVCVTEKPDCNVCAAIREAQAAIQEAEAQQ